MSLDDTLDRMRIFASVLEQFDAALRGSLAALDARHEEAQGLWQDIFAREYAAAWAPLDDGLRRWCRHDGPEYREFMAAKLRALVHYLDGDR